MGVIQEKYVVNSSGTPTFAQEVKIVNKFQIVETDIINQEIDVVLNKAGATSFFNFDSTYPYGSYLSKDSTSLLMSSHKFRLSRFGN